MLWVVVQTMEIFPYWVTTEKVIHLPILLETDSFSLGTYVDFIFLVECKWSSKKKKKATMISTIRKLKKLFRHIGMSLALFVAIKETNVCLFTICWFIYYLWNSKQAWLFKIIANHFLNYFNYFKRYMWI